MHDVDTAIESLRACGLRATPQRRAVIETLVGDTSHPLAEDVAARVSARMPGVSLSTVYKTLNELAAIGLIQRLDGVGAMRFDPDTSEHAHLTCTSCGSVVDLPLDDQATQAVRRAADAHGAHVARVSVDLEGFCSACSADA